MDWARWPRQALPLAIVLLGSFVSRSLNLGHPGLKYFDESFHAVVARNLMKHPLEPTLIDSPVLAYEPSNWNENHIWLHKPILALWQIAASYAVLGVNTLALRLPSLFLCTGAVFLTYLIGRALFDHRTGLIAAVFQGVNPAMTSLVQGYMFSDHIDIALLFYVELGIYLVIRAMKSGSWRDIVLAGVVQGLAYLTKSYLAALVGGVAVLAWLLPRLRLGIRGESRIRFRQLVGMACATLVTAAPWTIYAAVHYPREFFHEHAYVLAHIHSGIEVWGAPWDRVVFDYLIALYDVLYTPVIIAAVALSGKMLRERSLSLAIVYGWGVLVIAPHLLAATKTPSATLIGMPALFLLLAYTITESVRGDRWLLAAWVGIVVVSVVYPAPIRPWGRGYPKPAVSGGVMRQSLWVVGHVAAALALAVFAWRRARGSERARGLLRRIAVAATVVLCVQSAYASWKVTKANHQEPDLGQLAAFVRERLPANSVFIFEGRDLGGHQSLMLLADRPCYVPRGRSVDTMAREAIERGRIPYVVSRQPMAEPPIFQSHGGRLALFHWRPSEQAARGIPLLR
jgi:4-amino-4-deoxy-L-arabinose transferase